MDPYAVLGVDPTASDSEIRDAYLRRSKRLHPDQHANASTEARAAATQAMQDLNVAYDALRRREAMSPPSAPRHEPPPTYRAAPTKRSRRWVTVGLGVLVASALVAMVAIEPFDPTPTETPDGTVDLTTLRGRCLTLDVSGGLENVVDCTRPHDARVTAVVNRGVPCPVYTDKSMAGPTKTLCLETSG